MASGTIAGPTGARLPFFALELVPVSLADVKAHLGACECERVLEALNDIHQQGVLHGDIDPGHMARTTPWRHPNGLTSAVLVKHRAAKSSQMR